MNTRTLLIVCIALTLCAAGCKPKAETTDTAPPADETSQITMQSNSFLAAIFRSEVGPQIKQRMTTEELFDVFGEANVFAMNAGSISERQADDILRQSKAHEVGLTGLLCYADNGVRLGWLAGEEQWRLAEVRISGPAFRDGRKYEGPTQTPLGVITMRAPEFADHELLEMLLEVEKLRLVRRGMTLSECREAIGPESSGMDIPPFSLCMLYYDTWEDGELELHFDGSLYLDSSVCGSMFLRWSRGWGLDSPIPADETSE